MKKKPARDRATLLGVAKELRESAVNHGKLSTKQGDKGHYLEAHEWGTSCRMLHHWADHFEGQAKRCS